MFAKHQDFSTIRPSERSIFSDIRIFTNDFYTLKEHEVFPIRIYISFPPFDGRKAARNLSSLSSRCTRSRSTQFSILSVENSSLSLSLSLSFPLFFSRVPRTRYLFNFPTMRMRYGALRGFESANAANRYATSNFGLGE